MGKWGILEIHLKCSLAI